MSTTVTAPPVNGQVANTAKKATIKDHLNSDSMKQELARVLPSHCKPERMIRVALTAITRAPLLADCDQSSFFRCLLDLSQWGLEPDGRRAHLIPFRNNKRNCIECQLIIDYKGLVELAYNSGIVKSIQADVVRDGDLFDFNMGRVEKHVPWFLRRDAAKPEKAGDIFAVYCHVELKDGASKTEVMSRDEIEAIRKRSKAGTSGPWVSDWSEMAKKTTFRRLTKWLPLSAEVREAFDGDDDRLEEVQGTVVTPIAIPRTIDDLSRLMAPSDPVAIEHVAESTFDMTGFNQKVQSCKSPDDLTALCKTLDRDSLSDAETEAIDAACLERETQILGGAK